MAVLSFRDPRRPPRQEVLLAVEDDPLLRMEVSDYLRHCGYRVIEAANSDEAIRLLAAGTMVDLVFSDLSMPTGELDGFALAEWIGRNRPGLKVLVASGVSRKIARVEQICSELAVMDPPYSHTEFEQRIRELLARAPSS